MGYDLCLGTIDEAQLAYLRSHPEYTRVFIEGRQPATVVTETIGFLFSKREVEKQVAVSVDCAWPTSELASTMLYFRGGIYFMLNGTSAEVGGVTSFPYAGYRYPGDMLGDAIELGNTGFGQAHAFLKPQLTQLQASLSAIDAATVEARAREYAREVEEDEEDSVQVARADMESLTKVVDRALASGQAMIWFWV